MQLNDVRLTVRVSSRAKYMRLTVHAADQVVVTIPRGMSMELVRGFLISKSDWIGRSIERMGRRPVRELLGTGKREYQRMKEEARVVITERVRHFTPQLGVSYGRIAIRNQKACWGSCSRRGNLNFNYRLMHLEPSLRDYVIVHELCHLKEFNHSPRFWSHVETVCPDYLNLRKQLRTFRLR